MGYMPLGYSELIAHVLACELVFLHILFQCHVQSIYFLGRAVNIYLTLHLIDMRASGAKVALERVRRLGMKFDAGN